MTDSKIELARDCTDNDNSSRVIHYQPKAAIFEFYSDVKMVIEANGHEVVIGKCSTCAQTIRGSRNVTSNFVTHVKRLHPERQSDWERRKAERHGFYPKVFPNYNFCNTFSVPTQLKLQPSPNSMLCYEPSQFTQPSTTAVSYNYNTPTYTTQSSYATMVTQDSTLTTTVKQEAELLKSSPTMEDKLSTQALAFAESSTSPGRTDRKTSRSPNQVVSPDSAMDSDMWALLQAKQMLIFLVEQLLPLETADSPTLASLLAQAPQRPFSSAVLQNLLIPTCISHIKTSINKTLQDIPSVNVVITSQRKRHNLILFAVTVHYTSAQWSNVDYVLSVKYHETMKQFEESFVDVLVSHGIQNKVFYLQTTDMTNISPTFSLFDVPTYTNEADLQFPTTLAGIPVYKTRPLPVTVNDMLIQCLNSNDVVDVMKEEQNTHTAHVQYNTELPRWVSEVHHIPHTSDRPILSQVLNTLEPFQEIFDLLKSGRVLISVAIPSLLSLIRLISQKEESLLVTSLLLILKEYLEKLNENPMYRCASLLDPRFKLGWCKDKEDEKKVVRDLRNTCPDLIDCESSPKTKTEEPEHKRIKLLSYFNQNKAIVSNDNTTFTPFDRELQEYIQSPLSDEGIKPLDFWRENSLHFKILSKIAPRLLSIPIVQNDLQKFLCQYEKRIDSLEQLSRNQAEECLFLKMNHDLW